MKIMQDNAGLKKEHDGMMLKKPPKGYHLRINNKFVGLHENKELLVELEKVKDVRLGKQQECGKRKRCEMEGRHVR